jgi:ribosomal protein S18 acetylase RimI-like enzyme
MRVESIRALDEADIEALVALLHDAIEHGASVGYVIPANTNDLREFWRDVARDIAQETRAMVVARDADTGRIVASAQLELCMKPNGLHRAEVQKVLVHSAWRRRGLGRALMRAVEAAAKAHGRTLLVLDTESGSGAQSLYAGEGYKVAGQIPAFAIGNRGGYVPTTYMYKELAVHA